MSFTPAVAESLRQALATVVAVPVTPMHADGTPNTPNTPNTSNRPDWDSYAEIRAILTGWGVL